MTRSNLQISGNKSEQTPKPVQTVFPPEWEEIDSVLLTWPHEQTDWNWIFDSINDFYIKLSGIIRQYAKLIIALGDEKLKASIEKALSNQNVPFSFSIVLCPSDDTWARDHGPITVFRDHQRVLLDFQFNGWGGKFDAEKDNQITSTLCSKGGFGQQPIESIELVLEGGGIETDGDGTILTTSQCLLNPNRNPLLSKKEVETELEQHLGAKRVLWLDHSYLAGDDTDSHIDTLARFCSSDTIAYTHTEEPFDEHYDELSAMEEQLQEFSQPDGTPYKLIPLPLPSAIFDGDQRLPATYANFLILNKAVLFPVYNQPEDSLAVEQIKRAMPNHKIVPIDCSILIKQYGSLHCITMQIPAHKDK